MRNGLKEFNDNQYHHFTATVQKFGTRNAVRDGASDYTKVVTICLQDVTHDAVVLTDHVWDVFAAGLRTYGQLCPGDVIEFDAKITTYQKGYRGKNPYLKAKYPVSTDYALTAYANLQLVTDPAIPRRKLPKTESGLLDRVIAMGFTALRKDVVKC